MVNDKQGAMKTAKNAVRFSYNGSAAVIVPRLATYHDRNLYFYSIIHAMIPYRDHNNSINTVSLNSHSRVRLMNPKHPEHSLYVSFHTSPTILLILNSGTVAPSPRDP